MTTSDTFVGREPELLAVLGTLSGPFGPGIAPPNRVHHFWGNTRTGKTRLLKKLADEVQEHYSGQAFCSSITLARHTGAAEAVARLLLIDLIQALAGREVKGIEFPQLDDLTRLMKGYLKSLAEQRKWAVLLVDDVDLVGKEILSRVENSVLAPWYLQPNTLLVLAGRSSTYTFINYELRPKEAVNLCVLGAFEQELTRQQLQGQFPQFVHMADDIHAISHGVPGFNTMIAEKMRDRRVETITPDVRKDLLDDLITHVLDGAAKAMPEWDVRCILERLAVLDGFSNDHHETLPLIRKGCKGPVDEPGWRRFFSQIQAVGLGAGHLIRWDKAARVYRIDESVRCLLEDRLKLVAEADWYELHRAAQQLYCDWENDPETTSPELKAYWRDRAEYHRKNLGLDATTGKEKEGA